MGDRAMAEIRTEEGSLYFYTHWTGHTLRVDAEAALSLAQPRLSMGDQSYALKCVLDSLIKSSGARDSETGAGIGLEPNFEDEYNGDSPSVVIDLTDGTVTQHGGQL